MGTEQEEERPLIVRKGRLRKVGGTLYLAIPPEFVKAHGLKKDDEIPVLANHILKVIPMQEEKFQEEE